MQELINEHITLSQQAETDRVNQKGLLSDIHRRFIACLFISLVLLGSCKKDSEPIPDNTTTKSLIPDTGQTTSYTNTLGEDSDFNINPPSCTDNGNGTVTDNVTGLMWQKTDGGEMIFENTTSYCSTLNLGGYSDWRLPTCIELFGINSFDKVNPALNTVFFTKTAAEYWWTSVTRTDDKSSVWVVNAGGGIGAHPKAETLSAGGTKRFHVRAVRNTKTAETLTERFSDNSNGTITDNLTGLIWQKTQSAVSMTWEEALVYAGGLTLAGNSEWRLPNVKELQSLNEEKLSKPSFNKTYFPNVISGNYWSSTTLMNAPSKAWDLNVDYGIVSYNEKTQKEYVLCVTGGME
jgi:hypothetical protein